MCIRIFDPSCSLVSFVVKKQARLYNPPMRRTFLSFLCLVMIASLLSGCTIWAQPKVFTWKNATGAEQYERLLWQEVKAGNRAEIERHLASNFVFLSRQGRLDKQQFLAKVAEWKGRESVIGELEVTPQGSDMIVTYTASSAAGNHRYLSVWQQHKKEWALVAMSEIQS